MGYIFTLIYIVAAIALWRLWNTDHNMIWWCVFGSALFMYLSAHAVRIAYRQAMAEAEPRDELEAIVADQEANYDDVVRFWVKVNFVATIVTVGFAILGLVLSFQAA